MRHGELCGVQEKEHAEMTTTHQYRWCINIALSLIVALLLAVPAHTVRADSGHNPGVLPPNSDAFGKTYGEWSAAWWQYVELQPVASNPLTDPTGALCAVGQSGKVFFLVGATGSGTATRNQCTVPAGKALFFPLVNAFNVHIPCSNGLTPPACDTLDTPEKLWDVLQSVIPFRSFAELHASIDGVPVSNLNPATTPYRACAGPGAGCAGSFSLTIPAPGDLFGDPAGTYALTVADGFYLLLAPLAPGAHTITFGGSGLFSQDITYHLTVTG
jgi:hypothetical protein